MPDSQSYFKELIAAYGADVNRWPQEVRHIGFRALFVPQFAALIEEEKRFEAVLNTSDVPPAPRDLAQRIIAQSFTRRQIPHGWFSEMRMQMKPAALAAMLLFGFFIGFDMIVPVHVHTASVAQSAGDDDAALL